MSTDLTSSSGASSLEPSFRWTSNATDASATREIRIDWNLKMDKHSFLGMVTAYIVEPEDPKGSKGSIILDFGISNGDTKVGSRHGQLGQSYRETNHVCDTSAFNREQWNEAVVGAKSIIDTNNAGTCFFLKDKSYPVADEKLTREVLEVIDELNKVVLGLVGLGDGE